MKMAKQPNSFASMLIAGVLLTAGMGRGAETYDIAPAAVWSPTPTHPSGPQTLDNLIDGDSATSCCFLDHQRFRLR